MKGIHTAQYTLIAPFFITCLGIVLTSHLAHARDSVGDLNAHFIEPGDFAGAYKVMGKSKVPVSIAVGGYIKAVAITDNRSERNDTYFRPSLLSETDTEGHSQLNANFTRWYLDGRAILPNNTGSVRGYLETDFYQSQYRLRQAYLTWSNDQHTIIAGQTWTTFQDTSAYPEMIYELAPAGGVLLRQGQFRLTHQISNNMSYALAIENPSSTDIEFTATNNKDITVQPDLTAHVRWNITNAIHFQFSGLLRDLAEKNITTGNTTSALGYGTHISGSWIFSNNDKLAWSFLYGDGIGRYLIGASSFVGGNSGYIDTNGRLQSRQAMGGYASYKHFWNPAWRSNIVVGMSKQDEVSNAMTADNFESATFISANIFWHPNKVINTGVEITFGESEFEAQGINDTRDNTRIALVIQLF